jgi:hypothetical protein
MRSSEHFRTLTLRIDRQVITPTILPQAVPSSPRNPFFPLWIVQGGYFTDVPIDRAFLTPPMYALDNQPSSRFALGIVLEWCLNCLAQTESRTKMAFAVTSNHHDNQLDPNVHVVLGLDNESPQK